MEWERLSGQWFVKGNFNQRKSYFWFRKFQISRKLLSWLIYPSYSFKPFFLRAPFILFFTFVQVVHLPGHTTGSIGLVEKNKGILLTGSIKIRTRKSIIFAFNVFLSMIHKDNYITITSSRCYCKFTQIDSIMLQYLPSCSLCRFWLWIMSYKKILHLH